MTVWQGSVAAQLAGLGAPGATAAWMAAKPGGHGTAPVLQDLILYHLEPAIYIRIWGRVAKMQVRGAGYMGEVKERLLNRMHERGLQCRAQGRVKHIHSIYRKAKSRRVALDEVCDLVGFRIIVGTVKECYEALEGVHSLWRPVLGHLRDYVRMPKPNMYKSLHTTVIGPYGELVEVQIRTEEMHRIAEEGTAAHWRYKTSFGEGTARGLAN